MNNLPIHETYKGINIYVYEGPDGQGVEFDWYGRLQEAEVEEYEQPTFENKLKAARLAIDLLLAVKEEAGSTGMIIDDSGYLRSE